MVGQFVLHEPQNWGRDFQEQLKLAFNLKSE